MPQNAISTNKIVSTPSPITVEPIVLLGELLGIKDIVMVEVVAMVVVVSMVVVPVVILMVVLFGGG